MELGPGWSVWSGHLRWISCVNKLCLEEVLVAFRADRSPAIFGWLADHAKSRKSPLLAGYAALSLSTFMLHKGQSLTLLVLARVLQGFSAAAVCSAGFAMLYDAFGQDGVGGALGWVSAALDAGGFLGPGLSGILFQAGGENAVFISAYIFIAIDVAFGLLVVVDPLQEVETPTEKKAEYVPLPVSPACSHHDQESDVESIESIASLSEKSSLSDEKPAAAPVPRFAFFRLFLNPRLLAAISSWMIVGIFETAFDSVLPLFVEETFDWPVIGAGLIFIPFYLPGIILSPACGYIIDRFKNSSRMLAAAGFLLCGPSFILLGIVDDKQVGKQVLLCFLLTMIGIGTAFSGPPLLKEVGVVVEEAEKAAPGSFGPKGATARAYGVHNAAFAIGNLLGPIMAGGLNAVYGWAVMGWVFGIMSLVFGVVTLLFIEGWIGRMKWTFGRIPRKPAKLDLSRASKLSDDTPPYSPFSPLAKPPVVSPFPTFFLKSPGMQVLEAKSRNQVDRG